MIWSSLGRMAGEEEISVKEHLKSGEALSELLKRTEYVSPEQAFAWMKPVIKQAALEHERGRFRENIRPSSVIVCERLWAPFLIGEDVRKRLSGRWDQNRMFLEPAGGENACSGPSGTAYEAPEIFSGVGPAGSWSDVYSLCAVLYRMVTGKAPADAGERKRGTELKRPSQLGVTISPAWEEALMKGLELRPENRCQTGGELWRALYKGKRDDAGFHHQKTDGETQKDAGSGTEAEAESHGAGSGPDRKKKEQAPGRNKGKSSFVQIGFTILKWYLIIWIVLSSVTVGGSPVLIFWLAIFLLFHRWKKSRSRVLCLPRAKKDGGSPEDYMLGTDVKRGQILTITFQKQIPPALSQKWDVSSEGNRKVVAWREPDGGGYHFYIGARGGVQGGKSCAGLFSGCSAVREIRFNGCFDTSRTRSMRMMFGGCVSLRQTDADTLDMSRVRDAEDMWRGTVWGNT